MNDENVRYFDQLRDRNEIVHGVVRQLRIKRYVDCVARAREQNRVAVRCRIENGFGADRAACAHAWLDYDLLAPCFGELRRHQARDDVGRAAGCAERQYEAHGLDRILLAECV
jgi:hypothetical protein